MSHNERQLVEILEKIAELASTRIDPEGDGEAPGGGNGRDDGGQEAEAGCSIKSVPSRLLVKAAETAIEINPVNAPVVGAFAAAGLDDLVLDPQHLAVLTSKYWGPRPRRLTVSFMDNPAADLRRRIISHLNAWTRTGCIEFVETGGVGNIRISRGRGGFWSFLGTDVLLIPRNRPTMNLQGFTMNTSEREFKRVIRHEAGHTLGFPHEHMRKALVDRLDRQKTIDFFRRTQGWDQRTVEQQVLTPLDERSIMATPADQTSIMCYQLPGSITKDGRPIPGGLDINATDFAFCGQIYPRPGRDLVPDLEEEWSEQEDEDLVSV